MQPPVLPSMLKERRGDGKTETATARRQTADERASPGARSRGSPTGCVRHLRRCRRRPARRRERNRRGGPGDRSQDVTVRGTVVRGVGDQPHPGEDDEYDEDQASPTTAPTSRHWGSPGSAVTSLSMSCFRFSTVGPDSGNGGGAPSGSAVKVGPAPRVPGLHAPPTCHPACHRVGARWVIRLSSGRPARKDHLDTTRNGPSGRSSS
jgi:hypothetical protein